MESSYYFESDFEKISKFGNLQSINIANTKIIHNFENCLHTLVQNINYSFSINIKTICASIPYAFFKLSRTEDDNMLMIDYNSILDILDMNNLLGFAMRGAKPQAK